MPTPDPSWILGALAAAATAAGIIVHKIWPWMRRLVAFVNDVAGEPARPGVDARPGVMARLQAIEADVAHVRSEVTTNGGGSLKDALLRLESIVGDLAARDATPTVRLPTPRTSPEERT